MRLIDSKTQILRIGPRSLPVSPSQSAEICSPRIRQVSVDAVDLGGYALRGASMEAIYCPSPRVRFVVDIVGDTALDALRSLKAELREATWGIDGIASNVKTTNVSAMLVWTNGLVGANASRAAVSVISLRLTNLTVTALQVRVRTEVYSDQEAA